MYFAQKVVFQLVPIRWMGIRMRNPDLFRANRDYTLITLSDAFFSGGDDFPQLSYIKFQMRRRRFQYLRIDHADLADEIGNEAIPGKTIDLGGLIDLLDIAAIHHGNPV